MTKKSKQAKIDDAEVAEKSDYWTSPVHYAGCYAALLFWLMSMIHVLSRDWFTASVMGYVAGILVYVFYQAVSTNADPSIMASVLKHWSKNTYQAQKKDETDHEVTVHPTAVEISSPAQKLMQQFDTLYLRAKPKLPLPAQDKLQDIQDLLRLMTQKFERTQNIESQLEMLNVQRIIHQYITPLIEHYEALPVFLQDRQRDDAASPNEMLLSQLNLIHDEVLKMTEHVFHNNIEALSIHGEFLKQKLTPHEFFKLETEPK